MKQKKTVKFQIIGAVYEKFALFAPSMNKINRKLKKVMDFEKYLAEQLKNPEIKKYYDEYEKQYERSRGQGE